MAFSPIFDPESVQHFYQCGPYMFPVCWKPDPTPSNHYVKADAYESLILLWKEEKQARKDDAREHAREIRDAVAETRWHERDSAE